MTTLELTVKNFRCWEDKTITLPKEGICLLSGRSGKGKSTILNAIVFAVTGKGKNITTFQKKSTTVTLVIRNIDIKDTRNTLSITRTRGPNRLVVEREDHKYEDDEAQAIIDSVFGTEFCNTSYIDQENTNSFVFLSPSEKMEFLETLLLRHYHIDEMKEKVKESVTKAKFSHASFESKFTTLSEMKEKMTCFEQLDLVIDDKIHVTSGNVQKLLEKIKNNLDISEKNNKSIALKIKKAEQEFIASAKHSEKIQSITAIIDDTSEQLASLGEKSILLTEFESLTQVKANCIAFRSYFKMMELDRKINDAKAKTENLRQKYTEMTSSLHPLPTLRQSILRLEKANGIISSLLELEESIQDIQDPEEIKRISQTIEDMKNKKADVQKDLTNAQTCYKCPSCDKTLKFAAQKLTVDSVGCSEEDKQKMQKNIISLANSIESLERDLDSMKKRQTLHEKNESEYNRLFDSLEELLSLPTGETIQQEDIDAKIEEYRSYIGVHEKSSRLLQTIDSDRLMEEWVKERNSLNCDNYTNNTNHTIESLEENEEKYSSTLTKMSSVKEKIDRIRSLTAKLDAYTKEKNIFSDKLSEIPEISNLEADREKHDTYKKKTEQYRLYIQQLEDWIRCNESNEKYMAIERDISLARKNRDDMMERIRGLVKLRDHIKNAEQKSLTEFINSLNRHASIYIEEFFPDEDITVELKTTQEGKTSGKEKITLNFDVNYRKMTGDLSFLSGGEKDRVNLAFTLAFSELVDTKMLMLDECISSLDSETTNVVLENVKEKYRDKLVIVVSHQANLGFFDSIIEL
jgi:DNA repair exonuclease SbcCD ATPase subunit